MTPRLLWLIFFGIVASFLYLRGKKTSQSFWVPLGICLLASVLPLSVLPFLLLGLFLIKKPPVSFRSFSSSSSYEPPKPRLSTLKMCSKCGHENPANVSVCASCGNTLTV